MSGWDPWGPPAEDEDRVELPPEPIDPDAGKYGWGNYPEWPAVESSAAEHPDWGARPTADTPVTRPPSQRRRS
ncbi:MAG: hypothetical protein QOG85_2346, partial [Gaiellaceae bacterium]|nr:hypothetical protein [Gaiellaceae bacterium]